MTIEELIIAHTKPLIGLQLSYARRVADMRNFGFGQVREVTTKSPAGVTRTGSVGEYALHVQCPWRIESPEGIVTGRSDLWEPSEIIEGEDYELWDYSDGNMQDVLINELLGGYDSIAESSINKTEQLFVERLQADRYGGLMIDLSGGYRLVLFPSGSRGEDWRLLTFERESEHFVVSGGRVEEY